jgi:hypothetical protein
MYKICKQCNQVFNTDNSRIRLCDSCKEHNRKEHATTYMKKYHKDNCHHISISKEDNELLEKISANTGISKAKIIHILLENFKETY